MGLQCLLASHGSRIRVLEKSHNIETESEIESRCEAKSSIYNTFQNEQEFGDEARKQKVNKLCNFTNRENALLKT